MKEGVPLRYSLPHVGGDPISHQISARILYELKEGAFSQAKTLPSENDLALRYAVSRSVIRDALSDLEREGFLQRMRGIGTVIHRDIVNLPSRVDLKLEYNELIRSMGHVPSVDSISIRLEPAGERLAAQLRLDAGETVLVCEKRLLADAVPVIYSIDRLPLRLFGDTPHTSLDWSLPVFDLLEKRFGIPVDTDIAKISAVLGPPAVREKLAVAADDALLFIDEVGYYRLSHPIFHSFGYYTNFFDFCMLRKRF